MASLSDLNFIRAGELETLDGGVPGEAGELVFVVLFKWLCMRGSAISCKRKSNPLT